MEKTVFIHTTLKSGIKDCKMCKESEGLELMLIWEREKNTPAFAAFESVELISY